jgi:hypothetical protein
VKRRHSSWLIGRSLQFRDEFPKKISKSRRGRGRGAGIPQPFCVPRGSDPAPYRAEAATNASQDRKSPNHN